MIIHEDSSKRASDLTLLCLRKEQIEECLGNILSLSPPAEKSYAKGVPESLSRVLLGRKRVH